MKRLLLLIAFVLLSRQAAFASFTVTALCHGAHGGGGSASTTATCSGTATAGHTVVVFMQNEGGFTNTASDSGGSSYTQKTAQSFGSINVRGAYTLSQVGSGSITYTATWSGSTGGAIVVVDLTATGTISFDVEGGTFSTGTAADSGAFTTTGTDEVVLAGMGNENTPAVSALQINSVNADASDATTNLTVWWKAFAATLTNTTATATLTPSDKWIMPVLSFKSTGGGGTPTSGMLLRGVQ